MKERPILFSAPMVRAILDGKKTVTRRIVKYIPDLGEPPLWCHRAKPDDADLQRVIGDYRRYCPYGQPGDHLWVRETWAHDAESLEQCRASHEDAMGGSYGPYYRATEKNAGSLRWRPSIHMPRWASRLSLEVTEVKVEQLQDITDEQAIAEGACRPRSDGRAQNGGAPRDAFADLWESINGAESWDANPWVWVVEFKRVQKAETRDANAKDGDQ